MKNCFIISCCKGLYGTICNQTSKNATLPIMSASILANGKVRINRCPNILDVQNMVKILQKIGANVKYDNAICEIDAKNANNPIIDCELSKTMRSSQFLLGSMLARYKNVKFTMPGGCAIGSRPMDIHINAFKQLGVEVKEENECILFNASNAKANKVKLRLPSVGATENIVQFASVLNGVTTIINPAREPEVVDLCNFLNKMGAKILGAGTNKITIFGVDKLKGVEYTPIGDRIVAGTIMTAVAMIGGNVTITNACPYQNLKLIKILVSMGCQIDIKNDIIHISREYPLKSLTKVSTGFYPKFPTDMQSAFLTLCCVSQGQTTIHEKVFENRFLIVDELKKMGANINVINKHTVKVKGVVKLKAKKLEAKDLRGGAALVLAGLVAQGKTIVKNIHFIDRGYENLEEALNSLGAKIKRI